MIGFIGTSLQLQLIVRVHALNAFWTTSVLRISLKNLGLISTTPWIHKSTAFPPGPNRNHCLQGFHFCSSWMLCLGNHVLIFQATVWFSKCYPLLRNISCLVTCYLATTRSLLFVVTRTWFPIHYSALGVSSGSIIPAFSRHIKIFLGYANWHSPDLHSIISHKTELLQS
jgi:hypothetical protein